jgi:hypothetical protein
MTLSIFGTIMGFVPEMVGSLVDIYNAAVQKAKRSCLQRI